MLQQLQVCAPCASATGWQRWDTFETQRCMHVYTCVLPQIAQTQQAALERAEAVQQRSVSRLREVQARLEVQGGGAADASALLAALQDGVTRLRAQVSGVCCRPGTRVFAASIITACPCTHARSCGVGTGRH